MKTTGESCHTDREADDLTTAGATRGQTQHSRREVVRCGMKLAFMAPVVSTFLAKDALAANDYLSCHSVGKGCNDNDDCCGASTCDIFGTGKCVP